MKTVLHPYDGAIAALASAAGALLMAASWLVRPRGHVMIEALHHSVPDRVRRHLERLVHMSASRPCLDADAAIV